MIEKVLAWTFVFVFCALVPAAMYCAATVAIPSSVDESASSSQETGEESSVGGTTVAADENGEDDD